MKKFGLILLLLFVAAMLPQRGQMQKPDDAGQDKFVPGELLVKFADTGQAPAAHATVGAEVLERLGDLGWQRVRLPQGMSVSEATARYAAQTGVELAQPNYYYHLLVTPNDPMFGSMYGMTITSAPAAWDITTGSDQIVVAVIDTGARYTHQDLTDNIWRNTGEIQGNGVDDDGNGFIDDYYGWDFFFNDSDPLDENGHGTHTAGTVGARGNNGLGVTGVNWNVKVMTIKIYDSAGTTSTSTMLINAYNYVRLMKNRGVNLRVTSNSYGGCAEACGYDQATKDALDALGDAGVLNVFAAGNNNTNSDITPFYPANYDSPHVVSVASSTSTDARSGFSNFGATTVDLAAPGSGILSTIRASDSSYGNNSGTSMACPHVAGAAALLSAAHPTLSQYSLKASLLNNVDVLPQWSGLVLTNGRLNIARAIQTPTICAYSLNQTSQTFPATGGAGSVNITAPNNCGWETKTAPTWITFNTGRVGAGNGAVTYTVTNNTGTARSSTFNVAGQSYTVNQDAIPTGTPTISINDVSANEGNSGTTNFNFTVSLLAPSAQTVTVNYATADGTALAGSDYIARPAATLTFAPNETVKTVTVSVLGDTQFELDENFFVNLSNPTNATLADGQGQGTILNDEPMPSVASLSASAYTVNEDAGSLSVTVNRTGNTALASTVNYRTRETGLTISPPPPCTNPNASRARCDYVPTAGTLNFAAGETSKILVVPIIDDMITDPNETFAVRLLSGGSSLIAPPVEATATINDNDATQPTGSTYVGQLSSAQEVPTNASTANGTGTVTLNALENQITVNLNFTGLGSAQTAAHIHAAAHVGVNAPVLFNLGTGAVNGTTFNVTPAQVAHLKKGLMYFNVHTSNFGGGEIRGQILPNPLESARFFVQQQYFDFLSRMPDPAGWDYWTGQIVQQCGTDLACIHNRRLDVSAAFFIELEFQDSGAYLYRLYKAAFGEQAGYRPLYDQFVTDRQQIIGGTDLETSKLSFANSFAQRNDVTARYPATLTPAQFVDAILATVQQGSGVTFGDREKVAFVNTVTANGRGTFLRDLADHAIFKAAVYNRAFVLMQYFGYLKRDPDQSGYDFWLNVLNQQPNNFRGMVCAFATSDEYQQRYSAISTRSNQDCGQ